MKPANLASMACVAVATLMLAAACETSPPVQEMSDARQAIDAAREAGAAERAAYELEAAEQYLQSAERRLDSHEFGQARLDAINAKNRALNALRLSESGTPAVD